jgi:hypothetical protein
VKLVELNRNKKAEYLKEKINELEINRTKISETYRGVNEFKKGY